MDRTVELGRAVVSPTATNLELWLTTLITLSPRHPSIDLQQKLRKSQSASATRSPGIASFFRPSDGTLDVPLSEITETVDCSKDEDLFATEQARPPAQGRKRKRPLTLPSKRCASDFLALAEPDRQNTQKQPHTITAVPIVSGETPGAPEFQMVQDMVDAAVRISVLTNLKGSTSGLKIKASTFAGGLADIAPALWRLGYLAAITQRAHLITSLSLSFSRTSSRAKSEALQAKTAELVNPPYVEAVYPPRIDFVTGFDINVVTSTVANRVWIYAQKNILSRPTSGFIQSFCMPTIQDLTPAAYDEIPEEGGEGSHSHITPTPATLTAENIGEQSSAELYAKSIGSGDDDEMLFPAEQGLHTSTARSLCIQHLVDPVAAPRTPGQSDLDPVSRYNGLSDDSGIRTVGKNSGEEDGSFTKNDILGANACFYSGGPCDGKLPEARERVESIGILYF